jgi:hypothetical protein
MVSRGERPTRIQVIAMKAPAVADLHAGGCRPVFDVRLSVCSLTQRYAAVLCKTNHVRGSPSLANSLTSILCRQRLLGPRPREHVSAPTDHDGCMIGFQRQRLIVGFERCHIDQRSPPVLSSDDLLACDQSRHAALAERQERGGGAWGEGERFKRSRHDGTMVFGALRCLGVKRPVPAVCPVVEGATISGSAVERVPASFECRRGVLRMPHATHSPASGSTVKDEPCRAMRAVTFFDPMSCHAGSAPGRMK